MFYLYLVQISCFRLCQMFLVSLAIHCCVVFSGCSPYRLLSSPFLQLEGPYFPQPLLTERVLQPLNLLQFVLYWSGQNRTKDFRYGPQSAECPEYIHCSPLCYFHSLHFAIQLPFFLCAVTYSYWQSSQD